MGKVLPTILQRFRQNFTVETDLTLEMAEALLSRNPENRKISRLIVNAMKQDIINGNFVFNGEPIIISMEGLMNDGQHRCIAVKETKLPIHTLIVFGVTRDSRLSVDQGKNRLASDYLSIQGYEHSRSQAAVAVLLNMYRRNGKIVTDKNTYNRGTKIELTNLVKSDSQILVSVKKVANARSLNSLGGATILAFCHYLFNQIEKEDAEIFIEQMIKGENLQAGDPAFSVRECLINRKKLSKQEKIEAIFRGWNAFRERRKLIKVQLMGTFPDLI
jgi:hypothetical protein